MSNSTSAPPPAPRNGVLIQYRQARGWGRNRLAIEFERIGRDLGIATPTRTSMEKAIYRHETGQSHVTDDIYIRLYCAAFERSPYELFGDPSILANPANEQLQLTSNKFMPVYVGPEVVAQLGRSLPVTLGTVDWAEAWRFKVEHPRGVCTLYGFSWGCLVYHLEESLVTDTIAQVAVWRHGSYPMELDWTEGHAKSLLGQDQCGPEYVFSAFWVESIKWQGEQLITALNLLCNQKSLLDQGEEFPSLSHAELVEKAFFRDGYSDPRILDFGTSGISHAYASWSSVTYFPVGGRRALPSSALVEFEILVQSLWCYCHHVRTQVESGRDPEIPEGYDWRWLRGVMSRMVNATPQETAQHMAMRTTILRTSELDNHLSTALEILKDAAERQAS
jgi:hypothetical protein